MDCIFCKIVAGEIPSYKVYEDSDVLGFLDVSPISKGHSLIIPKKHYPSLLETPDELIGRLIIAAKKLGQALSDCLKSDGFNLFQNNGVAAGQLVNHLHFHLLPRFSGDNKFSFPTYKEKYVEGEAESLSSSLKGIIT